MVYWIWEAFVPDISPAPPDPGLATSRADAVC